jgi:two-component system, OmpR family, KDP operon response regulator KdpE
VCPGPSRLLRTEPPPAALGVAVAALAVAATTGVIFALRDISPVESTGVALAAHAVRRDGDVVHLTPIEFDLLVLLARNRGRLMTHRVILQEVWGPGYAEDVATLRTNIARLRRKIEPGGGPPPRYVRTDPGVGYRFDA